MKGDDAGGGCEEGEVTVGASKEAPGGVEVISVADSLAGRRWLLVLRFRLRFGWG